MGMTLVPSSTVYITGHSLWVIWYELWAIFGRLPPKFCSKIDLLAVPLLSLGKNVATHDHRLRSSSSLAPRRAHHELESLVCPQADAHQRVPIA